MPLYRPRPGRHLFRHAGGVLEFDTVHGWGSFDDDDDFSGPPATLADLGGAFVSSPDGQRVEVDQIFPTSPVVIEATAAPPFGEWEETHEIDVPDPDEEWERARNFGSEIPEFGSIPPIDEDPVFQLNQALANPIGHTVEWEGEFLRIRPTGAVPNHVCQFLATSLDDARSWLERRARRPEWTLDMQDPRYEVRRPIGAERGGTVSVVLVDVKTGEASKPIFGGVTSRGGDSDPSGFFVVTAGAPPAVGRWYR